MSPELKKEALTLTNAYLNGSWDERQRDRLEALIKADPELRRMVADFLHDHAALYCANIDLDGSREDDLVYFENMAAGNGSTGVSRELAVTKATTITITMAVAACVVIGLMLSWFIAPAWLQDSAEAQAQVRAEVKAEVNAEVSAETNSTAAYLTRAEGSIVRNGAKLGTKDVGLKPGDTIELESGLLELVFRDTDVHIIAVPPLKMTVISNMAVRLDQGELKLHVPPQGVGFEVETQKRKIIDLGTSFVVNTSSNHSSVLVLDGKVSVEDTPGGEQLALVQGEVASFHKEGKVDIRRALRGLPDLSASAPAAATEGSLRGRFFAFGSDTILPARTFPLVDHMGAHFLPLVESGFTDESSLAGLQEGRTLAYDGIAGAYGKLAEQARSSESSRYHPWMMWYQGKLKAPKPGRYRFWGYADNYLLVAINGKPILNGSRFDTALREDLALKSERHLGFPCFNAKAGIASGEWIELGDEPVQVDILFGEMSNPYTSGILMIEREGEQYPNTYWGQPQWPLFLTRKPDSKRVSELEQLNDYLENSLKGSFSIPDDAVWQVIE